MGEQMSKGKIIEITIANLKDALPLAVLAEKQIGYVIAVSIQNLEILRGMIDEPDIEVEEENDA